MMEEMGGSLNRVKAFLDLLKESRLIALELREGGFWGLSAARRREALRRGFFD